MAEKLRVYLNRKGENRPHERPPLAIEPGVIANVPDFVRITRVDGAYFVASQGPTIAIETHVLSWGKEAVTKTQLTTGNQGMKLELGSHGFIRVVTIDQKGEMDFPILAVTRGLKKLKI